MTPSELNSFMEDNQFVTIKFDCYDCEKPREIKLERISSSSIEVNGGAMFKVPSSWDYPHPIVCKCDECYEQYPSFSVPTSIYSRVVGYMRPVSSWNKAKQQEFHMRKNYKTCDKQKTGQDTSHTSQPRSSIASAVVSKTI